jgi:hypothetical protein
MVPPLEQSFDVLALDMPGFGHSPALPAEVEPTPEALADAVEGAMDAAGFATAHLAGNSLGAGSRWSLPGAAARARSPPSHRRAWPTSARGHGGAAFCARFGERPAPFRIPGRCCVTRSAARCSPDRRWAGRGGPIPTI